jgi:hypothetical protein
MKFAILRHSLAVLLILLFAIGPFIGVAYAGSVAERYGCRLDEGSAHPCVVNGVDRGDDLYALGMLGWLGLATLPLGMAALVVYFLLVLVFSLARRKRRKGTA